VGDIFLEGGRNKRREEEREGVMNE